MNTHQIIHFSSGRKATFFNIVGVKENEMVQLKLADGRKININKRNVDFVEIMDDETAQKTFGDMFGIYSTNVEKL